MPTRSHSMRRLRAMPFKGFPKETLEFLAALRTNNDKKWFDAHRADYESYFVEPAKDFVAALAPRLKTIDRKIHAEPRINGSILRIQRDVRFARDKSPYKDHLDLWFWTGEEKGWDSSGFFLRLTRVAPEARRSLRRLARRPSEGAPPFGVRTVRDSPLQGDRADPRLASRDLTT